MSAQPELLVVTEIYARVHHVDCPHCGAEVDGWAGDPRGAETTCDYCEKPFKVHEDADVELR